MRTLALVCLLAATAAVPTQPAKNSTPVSPEVHPDRKVTFRVRAPKATEDRVALGRCRPRAPTDPYVLALEHTVLQIMASLRVCKRNERCIREPADNAGAHGGNEPSSSNASDCGGKATSANDAQLPREISITHPNCP